MSEDTGSADRRGVRAPLPDRPLTSYEKYWQRTVRWRAAAEEARRLVNDHGHDAAREMLNLAVGSPAFFTDRRFIPELGRQGNYGFIILPGGCEWALKKDRGGQCAFCEFQEIVDEIAGDLPFSHEEFVALFTAGFATMSHSDIVNVFTAGSFLNPNEIPPETQREIACEVMHAPQTRILRVESRVQYMTEEAIAPLVTIMGIRDKTLDIAIGLETQDDALRNKVLRKGMGRSQFEQAVETAKRLGARVSAYVMLMPVDSSEGYAVQEAIASIGYAFDSGVDEVLLQARYSHYPHVKCPTLWSIAEVLRSTAARGPVMLGRWEGELPTPVVWPQNCGACTPAMMEALDRWRDRLDPAELNDAKLPSCGCRGDWEVARRNTEKPHLRGLPVLP